jgi:hypothetical protein
MKNGELIALLSDWDVDLEVEIEIVNETDFDVDDGDTLNIVKDQTGVKYNKLYIVAEATDPDND